MGLTRVSGDILQTPLNVGVVTATRIDGNVSGDINSTGVSTFSTLKVGESVNISGGIVTATTFSGNLTGNVTGNATGLSGTPNIVVGSITAASAVITGNVSVAGTVTYEDTTNVDSIGIITARSGVHITSGNLGIGTNNPTVSLDLGSRTDAIELPQGTTAQRPTGNNPYIRYNTTNSALEFYNGTDWVEIISDYFPTGSVILG
jgi:cytoskeletal protein CcmA (bactofilin family)